MEDKQKKEKKRLEEEIFYLTCKDRFDHRDHEELRDLNRKLAKINSSLNGKQQWLQ